MAERRWIPVTPRNQRAQVFQTAWKYARDRGLSINHADKSAESALKMHDFKNRGNK